MLPRIAGSVLLLTLVGIASAGGASHETVVKLMVLHLDQMSKQLTAVVDADTAKAARPELKKLADEWKTTKFRAATLLPPEPAVKERLAKEYRPQFDAALKKLLGQAQRVQDVPGGRDALQEISGVLNAAAP